jgi:hypothetical protein
MPTPTLAGTGAHGVPGLLQACGGTFMRSNPAQLAWLQRFWQDCSMTQQHWVEVLVPSRSKTPRLWQLVPERAHNRPPQRPGPSRLAHHRHLKPVRLPPVGGWCTPRFEATPTAPRRRQSCLPQARPPQSAPAQNPSPSRNWAPCHSFLRQWQKSQTQGARAPDAHAGAQCHNCAHWDQSMGPVAGCFQSRDRAGCATLASGYGRGGSRWLPRFGQRKRYPASRHLRAPRSVCQNSV